MGGTLHVSSFLPRNTHTIKTDKLQPKEMNDQKKNERNKKQAALLIASNMCICPKDLQQRRRQCGVRGDVGDITSDNQVTSKKCNITHGRASDRITEPLINSSFEPKKHQHISKVCMIWLPNRFNHLLNLFLIWISAFVLGSKKFEGLKV